MVNKQGRGQYKYEAHIIANTRRGRGSGARKESRPGTSSLGPAFVCSCLFLLAALHASRFRKEALLTCC